MKTSLNRFKIVQTKLNIFDHCPTKAEIVCQRIRTHCINADNIIYHPVVKQISIKHLL